MQDLRREARVPHRVGQGRDRGTGDETRYEKRVAGNQDQQGRLPTLAVLIEDNGYSVDPTGAVRRAARIAKKCVKLGGDWCSLGQHDEMEFLAINREYNEEFEKAWNMYETAKVCKDNMVNARVGV